MPKRIVRTSGLGITPRSCKISRSEPSVANCVTRQKCLPSTIDPMYPIMLGCSSCLSIFTSWKKSNSTLSRVSRVTVKYFMATGVFIFRPSEVVEG